MLEKIDRLLRMTGEAFKSAKKSPGLDLLHHIDLRRIQREEIACFFGGFFGQSMIWQHTTGTRSGDQHLHAAADRNERARFIGALDETAKTFGSTCGRGLECDGVPEAGEHFTGFASLTHALLGEFGALPGEIEATGEAARGDDACGDEQTMPADEA